jgi:hypothetical protein
MQTLKPFKGPLPFGIEADLSIQTSMIHIQFKLDLKETELKGLPKQSQHWSAADIPRKDGLWSTTCFEAFLRPKGQSSYFEFNFSLLPAWNAYEFTDYRTPQPPTPTKAFNIKSLAWDANRQTLTAEVENKSRYQEFEVSLTAVIEETNQQKHYWALAHTSEQPNFHAPGSFTILRGSPK